MRLKKRQFKVKMVHTEGQTYSFKHVYGISPALKLFTEVTIFINCILFL